MSEMKWWGWGPEGSSFRIDDKPGLGPFIREVVGLDVDRVVDPPPSFTAVTVPPSRLPDAAALSAALVTAVGDGFVDTDDHARAVHARGKSIRDLILQRRGVFNRVPDVVVRPGSEAEVAAVLTAAAEHDAVVIPFGGGSSISGSLEPEVTEERPVISLDLVRLDQLLELDERSGLARAQAGVSGPALEDQLRARGFTLGHFPDSFAHSTLGGWIATRSSGMQSDRYGDIADVTKGLRVVGPAGTLVVAPHPAMSNGPSLREMILGSEGRLGVITEATVEVRRRPAERVILGYLFPSFADGLRCMEEIARSEHQVSVSRVADPAETAFSFAMRKPGGMVDRAGSAALTAYLGRVRGWGEGAACLGFLGFEGSPRRVRLERTAVGRIVRAHGAIGIGAGPGALYDQKKFDTPYIRDFLLDRGGAGDVSETAAPWSRLPGLYDGVMAAARGAFATTGVQGYAMCHLSHSYASGACLYFTFAFGARGDMLAEYDVVKTAVQQAFVDHGATLSHHHAVGTEHAPWMEQDVSPAGVAMLSALFGGVDPGRHLNPGKIVG